MCNVPTASKGGSVFNKVELVPRPIEGWVGCTSMMVYKIYGEILWAVRTKGGQIEKNTLEKK